MNLISNRENQVFEYETFISLFDTGCFDDKHKISPLWLNNSVQYRQYSDCLWETAISEILKKTKYRG